MIFYFFGFVGVKLVFWKAMTFYALLSVFPTASTESKALFVGRVFFYRSFKLPMLNTGNFVNYSVNLSYYLLMIFFLAFGTESLN